MSSAARREKSERENDSGMSHDTSEPCAFVKKNPGPEGGVVARFTGKTRGQIRHGSSVRGGQVGEALPATRVYPDLNNDARTAGTVGIL